MTKKILIVEDDENMCELLETDLGSRGFEVSWTVSAEESIDIIKQKKFDAVLTDLRMPNISGISLCEQILANQPDLPVIVMTAFGSMETAIAAIRAGAYDFITKPVEMPILAIALERAIRHHSLQEQIKILKKVSQVSEFDEIIGSSSPMKELFSRIQRVANTDISVLITGESGTGKELVAKALHNKSSRSNGPFITINCAAVPETLLESELFGHNKGAFTDASKSHKGLFQQAEGGTIFLDEIGDFPLPLQPKLLRALEDHRVRPVGSEKEVSLDVRVISATNQNLETALKEGKFREDLYFRINVMQLELPPLRDRGTDILLIAQYHLDRFSRKYNKKISGLSQPVAERLLDYQWPGNIRELRNYIERAVALTQHEKLVMADFPKQFHDQHSAGAPGKDIPEELLALEEMEKRYILHVLEAVRGNRTQAAAVLKVDRKTLYRKLLSYDLPEEG